MFKRVITSAIISAIAAFGLLQGAIACAADDDQQKAILVTGASTGIGRDIAETLAENGYYVYAGARKQADLDALNKIPNIQALRLDVTKQDEIDERELTWIFDVNVMGVFRVTKAFAPLIIESKGRINSMARISVVLSSIFRKPRCRNCRGH
jgi:NADP-dependent 3-hydroxy acid dehydrogenase YdfG